MVFLSAALTGKAERLAGVSGCEDVTIGNISIWVTRKLLYITSHRNIRPMLRKNLTTPRLNITKQNRTTQPSPLKAKREPPYTAT
jgi:hypothetical protein